MGGFFIFIRIYNLFISLKHQKRNNGAIARFKNPFKTQKDMSLFDLCPLPAALTAITKQTCAENLGQVVKIAFWQKGATPFTSTTILTGAAWSTATALTTNGKVIVTNYMNNVVIPNSTKVEQTADTNILAMPELQRGSIVNVTAESRSLNAAARVQLKGLTPYTQIQPGVSNLVCVFITIDNKVIYNDNTGNLGFDVYNFFVSDNDVKSQLGALNQTMIDFYLAYGWSDKAAIGQAAFDLLNTYPV